MTSHIISPGTKHAPASLNGLTLLVVEDNPPIRRILVTVFAQAGADAAGAADAEAAVETYKVRAAEGRPFDAVVLDHLMPRRDGAWVASALRAEGFAGPIVGFSGVADGPGAEAWRQAGCDVVLRKGCPLRDLITAVAENRGR